MPQRSIKNQLNAMYDYYEMEGRHPNLMTDPGMFTGMGYTAGGPIRRRSTAVGKTLKGKDRSSNEWNDFVKERYALARDELMNNDLDYSLGNVMSYLGTWYESVYPKEMRPSSRKKPALKLKILPKPAAAGRRKRRAPAPRRNLRY